MRSAQIPVAIVWIGLSLLAVLRFYVPYDPHSTPPHASEAVSVAQNIYASGQFANPFGTLKTGPTAHVAPGYPYLMAWLLDLFGNGPRGAFAIKNTETVALVLQIALLPLLAREIGAGLWAGLFAACFALVGLRRDYFWECSYLGLLLVIATLLYLKWMQSHSTAAAIMAGFAWGLTLLFSPSPVLILIAWIVIAMRALPNRHTRLQALYFAIIPLIVISPWIFRDYRIFHRVIFLRDNFGLEMAVSYNPAAEYQATGRAIGLFHANGNIREAEQVVALGEPAYNWRKLQQAIAWIRQNPRIAAGLVLERTDHFWFPPGDRKNPVSPFVVSISSIGGVVGLVLLRRKNPLAATVLLTILLLFPLVYYLVEFIARYRYPMIWVTMLLSGIAVEAGIDAARAQYLSGHTVNLDKPGGWTGPAAPTAVSISANSC